MKPAADVIEKHWARMITDQESLLTSVEANVICSVAAIYPKLSSEYHSEDPGKIVIFVVLMQ